jgi:hypothetical protein
VGNGLFEDGRINFQYGDADRRRVLREISRLSQTGSSDKHAVLYGMGWMWLSLRKHAELRETAFSAETANQYKGQRQAAQD